MLTRYFQQECLKNREGGCVSGLTSQMTVLDMGIEALDGGVFEKENLTIVRYRTIVSRMTHTCIPFLAGRLSEVVSQFILRELRRAGIDDLLPCHGDLLQVLLERKTVTVMELTRLTHRSKSTVSALADKLVKLGYVQKQRSSEDSRVVLLTLTERGLLLQPVMQTISDRLAVHMTKGFSQEDIARTEDILSKMLSQF